MNEKLELRMYFFTLYQLTGIQKGIQCGHAALEYAKKYSGDPLFEDFTTNWKTWMVMNGGTTNSNVDDNGELIGGLNKIEYNFLNNGIKYAKFREPDLDNIITSICIICDERAFGKSYLSLNEYIREKLGDCDESVADNPELYQQWVDYIGGSENAFLRQYLPNFKFA